MEIIEEAIEFIENASKDQLKSLTMALAMMIPSDALKTIITVEKFLYAVDFDSDMTEIMSESDSQEEFYQRLFNLLGETVFKYENN